MQTGIITQYIKPVNNVSGLGVLTCLEYRKLKMEFHQRCGLPALEIRHKTCDPFIGILELLNGVLRDVNGLELEDFK